MGFALGMIFGLACVVAAIWIAIRTGTLRYLILLSSVCFAVLGGQVLYDCQVAPNSEACIWGKAFMPLTAAVAVVGGAVVYLLAQGVRRVLGR